MYTDRHTLSRGASQRHQQVQEEEQREAVRALLMQPLMGMQHESFRLVARHADALREWFLRETGWVLEVERGGARLFKRSADLTSAVRGLDGYDRRRYVLLCLACAVLERADPQITLRMLGERLLGLATEPELAALGFNFTLTSQHERRELVSVCKTLLELGVLELVAGEEEAFVQASGEQADALYDIHRRVLAGMLAAVRGPSTWAAQDAPTTLDDRLRALAEAKAAYEGTERGLRSAQARLETLRADPANQDANRMENAERDTAVRRRDAEEAKRAVDKAELRLRRVAEDTRRLARRVDDIEAKLGEARQESAANAGAAGMAARYAESALAATDTAALATMSGPKFDQACAGLRTLAVERRKDMALIRGLLARVVSAESVLVQRREARDEKAAALAAALARRESADRAVDSEGEAFVAAWENHIAGLKRLAPSAERGHAAVAAMAEWVRTLDGDNPARQLRTARRGDLPAAAQGGHRRRLCLTLDLGRPGQDARARPGPPVRAVMSADTDERLQRLLGGAGLVDLRRRLRRHFERAGADGASGNLRLGNLAPQEYTALAALMGRPLRQAASILIDITQIDAALNRAGVAHTLKAALEALEADRAPADRPRGSIRALGQSRCRRTPFRPGASAALGEGARPPQAPGPTGS
jgi:uncharacterized protein (TIGR02678 family)